MDKILIGTLVQEQHVPIGRVLAVDDDPESGAIAVLVQAEGGELRRLAPGTFHVVDGVLVVDAAAVRATDGESVPLAGQGERS